MSRRVHEACLRSRFGPCDEMAALPPREVGNPSRSVAALALVLPEREVVRADAVGEAQRQAMALVARQRYEPVEPLAADRDDAIVDVASGVRSRDRVAVE